MAGECKAIPYEGDAPFVFISYSHKNMKAAKAIIDGLYNRGYRVWYDSGVRTGERWPEKIAAHLIKSRVCISLLSEEYEHSNHCKNELELMQNKYKHMLPICLNGYEISPGIMLTLGNTKVMRVAENSNISEVLDELAYDQPLEECRVTESHQPQPPSPSQPQPPSLPHHLPLPTWLIVSIISVIVVLTVILTGVLQGTDNNKDPIIESPSDTVVLQSPDNPLITETPASPSAAEKSYIEDGGISYQLDDGTATVLAYSGSDSDVLIPSRVGGSEVTSISEDAFSNNDLIESVTLPATIEYMGSLAFNGCNNLQVLYSASLEPVTVEPSAFTNCPKLIAIQSGCSETAWNQPEKCKVFVTGSTTGSGPLVEILLDNNGVIYGRTEEDEAVVLYISEFFPADERYVIPNEIEFPDGSSLPVTYIEDTSITSKTKVNGIQLASDVLFSLKFAEQLQDWDIGYYYGYGKLSQCWLFSCFSSLMLENKRPSSVPDILPNVELTERAMDLARDVHMNPDSFEFDTWFEADNGETHYIITGSLQDVYDYLRYNTTLLTGSDCEDYTEIGVGCYYAGGGAAPRSCIIVRTAE